MASHDLSTNDKPASFNYQIIPTAMEPLDSPSGPDYSERAQWLRAAVLGANDGLLSISSLMVGIGAVSPDAKTMALTGLAGLFGGACSMSLGELVSVYSQYEIELAQLVRTGQPNLLEERMKSLPSPFKAAGASCLAFSAGAIVPILAAVFIEAYKTRLVAVVVAVSLALFAFGWLAAILGRSPPVRSSVRMLVGGWVAMGLTFGLTKLVALTGSDIEVVKSLIGQATAYGLYYNY